MESSCFRIGKDNLIEFGTILERSSYDDDPLDDFYEDFGNDLPQGHVRVVWRGGQVEILPEGKVKEFDHYLWLGAAVRRKGKNNHVGYCIASNVTTTVQIEGRKRVIADVKKEDLLPIQPFNYGVTVLLGSWVGMVTGKKCQVTVETSDGSQCNLSLRTGTDISKMASNTECLERRHYLYPGKQLNCTADNFQKGKWLHITQEMQHRLDTTKETIPAIVTHVNVVLLKAHWMYSVFGEKSDVHHIEEKPNSIITEDIIPKLIRLRNPCSNGTLHYYIIKETDHVLSLHAWKKRLTERMGPLLDDYQPSTISKSVGEANPRESHDTEETDSEYDEMENEICNVPGTGTIMLMQCASLSDSEAIDCVSEKPALPQKNKHIFPKTKTALTPGSKVLAQMLVTETTASVMWQDGSVENGIPSISLCTFWEHHSNFLPGDFVTEDKGKPLPNKYGVVQKVDRASRTSLVTWFEVDTTVPNSIPKVVREEEMSAFDMKRHKYCTFKRQPSVILTANTKDSKPEDVVGQVLTVLLSGKLEVRWFSGKTSHCYPHELRTIELIPRFESDGWEALLDTSEPATQGSAIGIEENTLVNVAEIIPPQEGIFDIHFATTSISSGATPVFSGTFIKLLNYCKDKSGFGPVVPNDGTQDSAACTEDMSCSSSDDIEPPVEDIDMTSVNKGLFSIQETVPDAHKFQKRKFTPTDSGTFFKTIKKEHNLLKTSLPEGIIVKGYEDRLDLYSVMIKGPKGTPYEDGLFLFDVQLPMNYPNLPPLFCYISYCAERFNPNLYHDGLVCVSLLGTWEGKDTEVWNPISSNLLQVIISIQGLILVAEPYFNEPGFERQQGKKKGQEMSQLYNEMVIIRLTQATNLMVSSPSQIFKDEILEHFKDCAPRFVQRLENWLNASENQNPGEPLAVDCSDFPLLPASKGFCLALRKNLEQFKETLSKTTIKLD